jgi:hypothetical protein
MSGLGWFVFGLIIGTGAGIVTAALMVGAHRD